MSLSPLGITSGSMERYVTADDCFDALMKKFVLVLVEKVTHSEEEQELFRSLCAYPFFPLKSETHLNEFLDTASFHGHLSSYFLFRTLFFLIRLGKDEIVLNCLETRLGIEGERLRNRIRIRTDSTLLEIFSDEFFKMSDCLGKHFDVLVECFLPYVKSFASIKQCLMFAGEAFKPEEIRRLREPLMPQEVKSLLYELMGNQGLIRLQFRICIAHILLQDHYIYLSEFLLYLFSEEEIIAEPSLMALIEKIDRQFLENNVKPSHYYRMIKLYLRTYMEFPFFRPMGEVRIRSPEVVPLPSPDLSLPDYIKKDTPIWRSIGEVALKNKRFWAFKLDRDFDSFSKKPFRFSLSRVEEIFALSFDVLFPATISIYPFSRYPWTKALGYRNINGPSGYFALIPDPVTLLKNWSRLTTDLPPPTIKIQDNDAASIEDFNKAFQTHEFYISKGSHFIHDQFQHLLPTINIRVNRTLFSGYIQNLERARKLHAFLCEMAREEGISQSSTHAQMFRLTAAIFVDIFMIRTTLIQKEKICRILQSGDFFSALWSGENRERWKRLYPTESAGFSDSVIERATKLWIDAGNSR